MTIDLIIPLSLYPLASLVLPRACLAAPGPWVLVRMVPPTDAGACVAHQQYML